MGLRPAPQVLASQQFVQKSTLESVRSIETDALRGNIIDSKTDGKPSPWYDIVAETAAQDYQRVVCGR